jgi:hypothetical protein
MGVRRYPMSSIPEHDTVPRSADTVLQSSIVRPVQFLGFWTAVVSPFVLAGLVVTGLATQHPNAMAGLLAASVTGIVLGNTYNR